LAKPTTADTDPVLTLAEEAVAFAGREGVTFDHREGAELSAEELLRLRETLRSKDSDRLGWWVEMAECWLAVGYSDLARACLDRARLLLDAGKAATPKNLARLASLRPKLREAGAAINPSASLATRPRIATEAGGEKASRIRDLLGRGDNWTTIEQLQVYARERDLEAMMLCAAACLDRDSVGTLQALLDAWYRANEPQAAVEALLALLHDVRLDHSLSHWPGVFVLGGFALRQVGDPITAFACFQLVSLFYGPPAPDPAARQTETEKKPEVVAVEEAGRLRWAEASLCTAEGCYWLSPSGSRIAQWLLDHGLAGKWREIASRSTSSPGRLYPPPVVARQLRLIGERSGWSPLVRPTAVQEGNDRNDPPRRATTRPPGALPLRERTEPREDRGARDSQAPVAHVLHFTSRPQRLPAEARASSDPVIRLHIGYSAGRRARKAHATVTAKAPLLCMGRGCDDDLAASLASQLAHKGLRVVWFRGAAGAGEAAPDGEGADPEGHWRRLRPAASPEPGIARWLRDLAAFPALRRAVSDVIRGCLPLTTDPAAEACLDGLLGRVGDGEIWSALAEAEDQERNRAAVKIVSECGDLRLLQPIELRRGAFLVGYVSAALSALRHGVCHRWEEAESDSPPTGPLIGLVLDLAPLDPAHAGLATAMATGSLIYSLAQHRRAGADEFPLVVRKRSSAPEDPPAAKELERMMRRFTSPRSEPPGQDLWTESEIFTGEGWERVALVVSCEIGAAARHLVEWMTESYHGAEHLMVVAVPHVSSSFVEDGLVRRFRSLVLGPLTLEERKRIELASGMALPEAVEPASSDSQEVRIVDILPNRIEESRAVLWPSQS
jgi:hypothetical protein